MQSLSKIIITGPTASGKSSIALNLAKIHNAEIINIDSMQIYKEIPIISAAETSKEIVHHLYSYIEAKDENSNIILINDVIKTIQEIEAKNKNIILVGGSPFYIRTLIDGISNIPHISQEIKTKVQKQALENYDLFYEKLIQEDENILKINKNDKQRILRAAYVLRQTNKSIFHYYHSKQTFIKQEEFAKFMIIPEKEILQQNVKIRLYEMIANGAIEEVKNFIDKYKNYNYKSFSAYKAIGIREIESLLLNQITFQQCIEQIVTATMQYVKRQKTWFRKFNDFQLIDKDFFKQMNF